MTDFVTRDGGHQTPLPVPPDDERFDRIAQTLSVIALTLADFRERIETLERPSRWARLLARARAYMYFY